MLEVSLFLVVAVIVGFAYLVGYCRGRWAEARSQMTPMVIKYLDDETKHEQQLW
jgi:hypothetical protein